MWAPLLLTLLTSPSREEPALARSVAVLEKRGDGPFRMAESRQRGDGVSLPVRKGESVTLPPALEKTWLNRAWQDDSGRFCLLSFDGPPTVGLLDVRGRRLAVTFPRARLRGRPVFLRSVPEVLFSTLGDDGEVSAVRLSLLTGESRTIPVFDLAFEDPDTGAVALVSNSDVGGAPEFLWLGRGSADKRPGNENPAKEGPGERGKRLVALVTSSFRRSRILPEVVRETKSGPFLLHEAIVDRANDRRAVFRSSVAEGDAVFYSFGGEGWSLEYVAERSDGKIVLRGLGGTIVGTPVAGSRQVFYLFDPIDGGVSAYPLPMGGDVSLTIVRS